MVEAIRRSALEGHLESRPAYGVSRVSLLERRPRALAMVMGAHDGDAMAGALGAFNFTTAPAVGRVAFGEAVNALWVGPGQYLVESSRHHEDELERSLATALAPLAAVSADITHARTVFRLDGASALDVLAKGCPLDLEAMRDGDSAASMLSHFNVYLSRDDSGFDVYVFRSFGLACLEWLLHAGDEYGIELGA